MTTLFAFSLGYPEIFIILIVGVLLFGRRLPEVGRYLGKGIVEFKKGIKGVEDDVDVQTTPQQLPEPPKPPQRVGTTAPKFEE
jgi:sec-independent protein translocase protein TatA